MLWRSRVLLRSGCWVGQAATPAPGRQAWLLGATFERAVNRPFRRPAKLLATQEQAMGPRISRSIATPTSHARTIQRARRTDSEIARGRDGDIGR